MVRLVVTFEDADHCSQEWTASEKGKEETAAFKLRQEEVTTQAPRILGRAVGSGLAVPTDGDGVD